MACGAILTAGPAPSPREYDVRIPVNATVTLAGTLSLPMGDGPHPAVILLAGGAPDDRDASIGDFAPFRIMAAALVRRGVAVLRFDDRGVGGSTGEIPWHYPLTELATDVTAAIRFLRQRERIDPQRIGLCGHCLGALLAARAAEEAAPIRFLVLLTPPATTGAEQWLAYRRLSESGKGKSGPEIEQALEVDRRFIAAIAQGADPQPFRQEMRTILQREYENRPEPALQGAGSFEDYFNGSDWAGLLSFGPTPFGRSNFAYDPAPAYRRVTVPTLVLLGGADTAIPPAIHQPLLERAFDRPGSSPADIRLIPGATHYFTTTMAASGMAFVPDFLHSVTDWICRQAGLPNTVTPDNR
ncbi:MAG: alpha/beta fold hydrolase [Acidobacteria bacterium]|nr:alpha/beta fold hydrolase [Acidobacteriota bacterium]